MSAKKVITEFFSSAGVAVDGKNPWDIRVLNEKFYSRALRQGSLGLGDSYMDGWWECDDIPEFINHIVRAGAMGKFSLNFANVSMFILENLLNMQDRRGAKKVGEIHYDAGNDLYEKMLGRTLAYSCGYWKDAKTLDEAQDAKLDLICRKIGLKPGMKVLDIGCGWGSFAKFAAEKYGASVVGVTISKEQKEYAERSCKGLPVEIRFMDYRDVAGEFDRVVSIGMFEHVGKKNYREYMRVAHRLLKEGGLFLLHTIGTIKSDTINDAWIEKHIFPHSMLPSVARIGQAAEMLFVMEDWHNFGPDYEKTLLAWFENFEKAWPSLREKYGDRFYRMWKYYLLTCAGSFRSRNNQLWQVVFSKNPGPEIYQPVR